VRPFSLFIASAIAALPFLVRAADTPPATVAAAPAAVNYTNLIAQDRAAWVSSSNQIADVLRKMKDGADQVRALDRKIREQNDAIRDMEFQKKKALDELRRGEFCTGCGQTRSQIEASGQHFPHPGQQVRPATPEELEKCKKDFDDRLAKLRLRLNELEKQKRDASDRLGDAYFRFMNLYPAYHHPLLDERDHRLAQWRQEAGEWEKKLHARRGELESAQASLVKAEDVAVRQALESRIAGLAHQLARDTESARAAASRATQDQRAFVSAANADLDRLGTLASSINAVFGIPDGWYIDKVVRGVPAPLSYVVYGVSGVDRTKDAMNSAQELLEGARKETAKKQAAGKEPSARALLEGK